MKMTSVGMGLAGVLLLAGCSGASDTQVEQTSVAVEAGTSSATPTATGAVQMDSILKKSIGDQNALGCDVGASIDTCDVRFVITSITRGEQCSYKPLADDQEVVRFGIEVETAPTFKSPGIDGLLLTQYWSLIGPDGYLEKNPDIAIGCEVDADVVYEFLEPGTRQRSSVPVVGPKGATTLRLSDQGRGWEWEIPA